MPKVSSPGSFAPTVLQVIPELDAGGAERTCVDVAAALVHAGGEALVASRGGRLADELRSLGGQLRVLPMQSKNPLTIFRNIFRLRRIIVKEGVVLVHARSRAPAWSAYYAAKLAKVPFVTTYHGTYNANSRLKRFYNSIMARGEIVIANSYFIAGLIEREHSELVGQVRVIHRGSDIQWLDPSRVEPWRVEKLRREWEIENRRELVILLPGRLTRWKGHEVFIDAVSKLTKAGEDRFLAVIVGDAQGRDDYVAGLKKTIRMLQLSDSVRIAGHCEDMPAAYAIADLVVSASTEPEAFGRIAVEAQAMGRPIIATGHGGASETVLLGQDIATGWRVTPGDASAMAEALQEALNLSPEMRAEMGRRGRANAEANFSVRSMCRKTLDVYREIADRNS